jgi:hypothetical protein
MAAGTIAPDPDLSDVQQPSMPPIQGGQPPGPAASPSQPAAPGAGAAPPLSQPQPGRTIQQGTGKGEIATPDVKPEYDPKKLAKAQTTLDLLNAMKPQSRTDYMDWWQKQHGDIDEKYDNMKSQMGARPSDDEPQTKKEKFAALLEFGLHLMKASAPATTNQGAVLAGVMSDQHDANQGQIADKQKAYDTQAQGIETARAKEQAGIGTPAAAMAAQEKRNLDETTETKNVAGAFKDIAGATATKSAGMGAATYAVGPGGVIHTLVRDEDGHAHAEPVTGIDGKPFQGRVLGKEAGSGIDKSNQDPAAVRTHKYLTNVLGMDQDTAAKIAFKPKTGSVNADHAAIYKSVMQATMGDDEKAKRVADQYILDQYGAGAVTKANAPIVQPGNKPPPQALQGLKPGMVRDFGAQGKWTIGIDGQPTQVSSGPLTRQ